MINIFFFDQYNLIKRDKPSRGLSLMNLRDGMRVYKNFNGLPLCKSYRTHLLPGRNM